MSVVGFDIGNMNSIIAVARNRGVDVICNEVSNRATPSLVSFGPKQRHIGESAKSMELGNFKNTVGSLKRLIGRKFSEKDVTDIEAKYLNCELVPINGGNEIGAKVQFQNEERVFSYTQLMAMYINKLKQITEQELKSVVTDCVISVPLYFTDAQRRALIDAADIAGVKALRLIPDVTASALQWGITKTDLPDPEAADGKSGPPIKYVAFVDIGQSDTSVSIVGYQKGKMMVKGVAYDRHLGGRNFDEVLVDYFVKDIQTKYKMDVRSNPKALFRLRSTCEKTKKILSANLQAPLSVECLMNDKDVSSMIERPQFEGLIQPLIERVLVPMQRALDIAGVSKEDIDVVEIVGGSTRIPAVKTAVSQFFGKELSTTLNQDECVAKGCTFMCAILSPVFRTREFKIDDVYPFPIKLKYEMLNENGVNEQKEMVAFASYSTIPNTKLLTFNRNQDFDLVAEYSDESVLPIGSELVLGKYSVKGVQEQASKAQSEDPAKKEALTVKVKIRLNPGGVLEVSSAYVQDEVTYTEMVPDEEALKAQKEAEKKQAATNMEVEEPAEQAAKNGGSSDEMDVENKTGGDAAQGEKKSKQEVKKEVPMKQVTKTKTVKKELPVSSKVHALDRKVREQYREDEAQMNSSDKLVKETEDARNSLEEFVYELRGKLEGDASDQQLLKNPQDAQKILKELNDCEEWLYGEGEEATKSAYLKKLEEFKSYLAPPPPPPVKVETTEEEKKSTDTAEQASAESSQIPPEKEQVMEVEEHPQDNIETEA
ncbi:hypothetical protein MIR68_000277 [Amoeboaphelidium protococcarum]|nr:hypothetical protein MIR68_000277 [Amoeboaphelidium protococcarum]